MSTYEPGTVALATVRGVPNVRVMLRDIDTWFSPAPVEGLYGHENHHVTDIRPLVVLDLDPALRHMSGGMHALPAVLKDMRRGGGIFADRIADQIEAQTKPPRIPEPGLWGVVQSGTGHHWVRSGMTQESLREWQCENGARADWHEIAHPTLVRPGIEDES